MQYIISISIILLSNYKKKSKLLIFLLFINMWFLFAFNTNNADYEQYKLMYQGYNASNDVGFMKIIELFNYYNLSYQDFLIFVSFICLFCIIKIIQLYTKNVAYVMGLYFIFPFLIDVTQIRNFISMVIVLFGMKYLLIKENKSIVKYICCVLLASTVHISSLFYFTFLLSQLKSIKKLFIFILFTCVGLMLMSFTDILPTIASFTDIDKFIYWFSTRAKLGFLIPIFIQLCGLLLIYCIYLNKKKYIKNDYIDVKTRMNTISFLKINIILLLIVPLYIYNGTFFRLYRNMLIINYCFVANNITLSRASCYSNILKYLYLFYVILLFYYFIINRNFNTVFLPIFNNNIMLN